MKLSVVVLTKNEEDRIKACLESVKWADEIIILDQGSTDKTLQIAKEYTDKIFVVTDPDFSKRRNRAMEEAKGDWVLYVDADERVLEPLKKEILQLIEQNDKSAFAVSRINIIFGQEKKYGSFWPDWMIRLFKKDRFKGWVGEVHEYGTFYGDLGYTKNSLLHLTHRSFDQIITKSLEWSKIDANLRLKSNHPNMSGWRFLRIMLSETYKQGVIRRGFFNGTVGVMDSLLQVFYMLIVYIRLWEAQQKEGLEERYDRLDQELIKNDFTYKS